MISSKDVKIKAMPDFTSEYVESELSKMGYDVLRWAITSIDGEYFVVNIAYVQD